MSDLRNIDTDELSKDTNPFHINLCEIDSDRIHEAYPKLIINEMFSSFNHQTNEYIAKQLIALNIDKDVLIKQTQELNRLNSHIQELCDKARADERTRIISELKTVDKFVLGIEAETYIKASDITTILNADK